MAKNPKVVRNTTRKVLNYQEGLGHVESSNMELPVPKEDELDRDGEERQVEKVLCAVGAESAKNTQESANGQLLQGKSVYFAFLNYFLLHFLMMPFAIRLCSSVYHCWWQRLPWGCSSFPLSEASWSGVANALSIFVPLSSSSTKSNPLFFLISFHLRPWISRRQSKHRQWSSQHSEL